MTIIRAYYPERLAEPQGWFIAESTGGVISDHIHESDSDDKKNGKAPGITLWLADPANTIEPYQIPVDQARKNFRNNLDASVRATKIALEDRDGIYDSEDPEYYLEIWEEFFEFQKWYALTKPRPARPATPKIDFYAEILRAEINDPSFGLGNARGRLRAQLNNRRFKIMLEDVDAAGNLVRYRLRQPPYISMQKEAKQYEFFQINNSDVLPENEKADQIQALAETLVRNNGEPKRFAFDDDPANPKVSY